MWNSLVTRINQIKCQYQIKQCARRRVKRKLRQGTALGVAPGPSTSECTACLLLACAACPRVLLLRFLQSYGCHASLWYAKRYEQPCHVRNAYVVDHQATPAPLPQGHFQPRDFLNARTPSSSFPDSTHPLALTAHGRIPLDNWPFSSEVFSG